MTRTSRPSPAENLNIHSDSYLRYYDDSFLEIEENFFWFLGRSLIVKTFFPFIRRGLGAAPRVVEIGCGGGGMLAILQTEFGEAFGYDADRGALAICKKRGLTSLSSEDIRSMPDPDGSIDLVCSFDVFEHFEDDLRIMRECFRVLKPGGFLMATVPAFMSLWSPVDEHMRHFRRYGKVELEGKLRQCGFKPLRISYYMFLLFPLFWLNRFLVRRNRIRPDHVFDISPLLNKILRAVVRAESFLFRFFPFPVGSSLVCLAEK